MKAALFALLLAALPTQAMDAQERLAVTDQGFPTVRVPGRADVTGRLFLWYDRWIWRSADSFEPAAEGRWHAVIAKRPEDGPGAVEITQTATREGDALRLDYEFRRRGDMHLTRGIFLSLHLPFPDYGARPVVFTHGPPATTDRRLDVAARGATVNLTDSDALEVAFGRATRFGSWVNPERGADLNVRLVPAEMGETARATVTLRLVPAVGDVPPWRARPRSAPLELRGVRADREEVGRHQAVEFTLDLSATFENPFDPQDVSVEAAVETPSGSVERRPGFYCQPFEAEYEEGEELLSLGGEPSWKVRYTPREVGGHVATFRARDRSGEATSEPVRFRCVGSDDPGFVRIGPAHDGAPRYFRLDDGTSLFLIGHNVIGYPGDLDDVFARMAAGGENYTRLWMWSQSLGLEWDRPVGRYRMQEAWRLDRTFELARRHGILLMLCLDTHQDFIDGWQRNPYSAAQGGPCAEPMDFFTNERAKELYRQRLRYVIARWGHHPNLLCWEFGNEMEGWPGAQENRSTVAAWHAEMAGVVSELDAFGHAVTSSLWTTDGWPELWNLPQMEFVQSHFYANNMWADMAERVAAICEQKRRDYPEKLHVFGEYGISDGANTRRWDPAGVHLHNGNWAALMSGCGSNPVSWWHDEYIHALDLYPLYGGLAAFVHDEPLADVRWRPLEVASAEYVGPLADLHYSDLEWTPLADAWSGPVPEGTRFVARRDGAVENLAKLPDLLHGGGHPDLRSPFVFEVDCRRPGRFEVHVGTVSASGELEFQLDGQTMRTVDLPTGEGLGKESQWQEQWQIWQTVYDESYGIDVPAGRHTIRLANGGDDWVQIGYFKLEDYVTNEKPPLRVLGMASDDRALLWAQNKAHTWFNVRERRPMPPVEATRVTLNGFADGRWGVEFWDTVAGQVTATAAAQASGGTLALELPAVATDLAVKLLRR